MRQQTLAETLRAYFEADAAYSVARHSMQSTIANEWTDDERAQYLRGHYDRQSEIDALTARVRELEVTLLNEHSRLAQEEAQPAQEREG